MKKIIYVFMSVLLGGSLVSAEQIQSIMFNPSRLGLYQQLRVTETMRVEGSVKAPVSVIAGNSTVTVQSPFDISIVDGTRGTIYMPDTELQQSGQMGVFGGKAYFGGSVDSDISSLPEATWLKASQVRLNQLYLKGYSGATFDSDDANTKDQAGILNLGGNVIPHPDDACTGKLAWEDRQVGDTLYQVLALKGCPKPEGGDTCTDSYGTASITTVSMTDTCDGDTSNQFTCSGTAKECTDVYEVSRSVGQTAAAADYLAWALDSDFNTDKSFFVAAGSCGPGKTPCSNFGQGNVCCPSGYDCRPDSNGIKQCVKGQTPGGKPSIVTDEPVVTPSYPDDPEDPIQPDVSRYYRTVKCCDKTTPPAEQTCEENPKQAKCCDTTAPKCQIWNSSANRCEKKKCYNGPLDTSTCQCTTCNKTSADCPSDDWVIQDLDKTACDCYCVTCKDTYDRRAPRVGDPCWYETVNGYNGQRMLYMGTIIGDPTCNNCKRDIKCQPPTVSWKEEGGYNTWRFVDWLGENPNYLSDNSGPCTGTAHKGNVKYVDSGNHLVWPAEACKGAFPRNSAGLPYGSGECTHILKYVCTEDNRGTLYATWSHFHYGYPPCYPNC